MRTRRNIKRKENSTGQEVTDSSCNHDLNPKKKKSFFSFSLVDDGNSNVLNIENDENSEPFKEKTTLASSTVSSSGSNESLLTSISSMLEKNNKKVFERFETIENSIAEKITTLEKNFESLSASLTKQIEKEVTKIKRSTPLEHRYIVWLTINKKDYLLGERGNEALIKQAIDEYQQKIYNESDFEEKKLIEFLWKTLPDHYKNMTNPKLFIFNIYDSLFNEEDIQQYRTPYTFGNQKKSGSEEKQLPEEYLNYLAMSFRFLGGSFVRSQDQENFEKKCLEKLGTRRNNARRDNVAIKLCRPCTFHESLFIKYEEFERV